MDIVKAAVDWARAEMLSSAFFILFGAAFVVASVGFWQLGKTDVARAYVVPALVAGVLLLIIGLGIFFQSQGRVTSFPAAHDADAAAFIAAEIQRADNVMGQYRVAVFMVIPLIVAVCAVLVILFESAIWRASLITIIAMMAVILIVDTNANARLEAYKAKLQDAETQGETQG